MKDKLRWIIPLSVAFLLILFLIGYYNLKPRLGYVLDEKTNTYLVDKAYGNSKEYVIPELHNGKNVSGINTRAFYRHTKLEKIVFEKAENIKIIKRLAFSECEKLSEIDLSTVNTIERNAFSYDYSLDDIKLSAIDIGSSAFYKCTSLEDVEFLEGLKTIGAFAFSYCPLKEVKMPKSISIIYQDAFKYCEEITKFSVYYKTDSDYAKTITGYEKYYD